MRLIYLMQGKVTTSTNIAACRFMCYANCS